ncbi:hypothetical protein PsYK624_122400 [Phanerochaete sordida]|uniref:DUF6534 domain-containing protein n=1 Tax=Phanerochaete sordida TaxID=48140 RepID=A0A9P3GJ13_9APHY|nr:hypothetical protein PsYK624_122400 [Phanerochaete sordida]
MTGVPPPVSSIDTAPLAGPVLLGYLFNWGLFGVLSVQVCIYHVAFPKDKWTPKTMVYIIYCIELAQTILVTHDCFNAYARHFGDLEGLNAAQTEWLAVPIFSAIVSCVVQMYYAYRLEILSGSRWLRAVVSLIALTQGGASLAAGGQAFGIGNFSDLAKKASVSTAMWLAGWAVCDVVIALCMAYYLSRGDSGLPTTHAVITRLLRLIVGTGSLTAIMATVDLILYFAFPHEAYHGCIALVLAKLYSNSLLVLFNSRIRIVGSRNWSDSSCVSSNADGRRPTFAPGPKPDVLFPDASVASLGSIRVERGPWRDGRIELEEQKRVDPAKTSNL